MNNKLGIIIDTSMDLHEAMLCLNHYFRDHHTDLAMLTVCYSECSRAFSEKYGIDFSRYEVLSRLGGSSINFWKEPTKVTKIDDDYDNKYRKELIDYVTARLGSKIIFVSDSTNRTEQHIELVKYAISKDTSEVIELIK